ncbi:hypothetical protein DPMN_128496 [Dreissena polymorpha]|uniref:Uncharacterized protein n=1 Tax=Dreissena polymorpha TaxID=45954 RepID=A0A9D4H197_DREPO|nr:hypothetical protein DPMN_128496 [Dreissena polymorpha]
MCSAFSSYIYIYLQINVYVLSARGITYRNINRCWYYSPPTAAGEAGNNGAQREFIVTSPSSNTSSLVRALLKKNTDFYEEGCFIVHVPDS